MSSITVKSYDAPEIRLSEVLRYSRFGKNADSILKESPDLNATLNECIKEASSGLTFRVVYSEFDVSKNGSEFTAPFPASSQNLARNLEGCSKCIMFCASVGLHIDRLIRKYTNISPLKALLFQGIGAERVESLSDMFNNELRIEYENKGLYLKPRYSPGYGDLSIKHQKDLFRLLDITKNIGVFLNDSFLMTPSKSVTAIIGITDRYEGKCINSCADCNKKDCELRIE